MNNSITKWIKIDINISFKEMKKNFEWNNNINLFQLRGRVSCKAINLIYHKNFLDKQVSIKKQFLQDININDSLI